MSRRKTHAEFVEQANERNIDVIGKYVDDVTKIKLSCQLHDHEWLMAPGRVISGRGCKMCGLERLSRKLTKKNEIIEDRGNYLIIDISTKTYPSAKMAVDTDVWMKYKGGKVSANLSKKYIDARCQIAKNKRIPFHHFVIDVPAGMEIDHKRHGDLAFVDNRRSNLRIATNSQNTMNQSIRYDNTSGVTGVRFNKESQSWTAIIGYDRKSIFLGYFKSKDDAIIARRDAEKKYFGEYAFRVNNKKGVTKC